MTQYFFFFNDTATTEIYTLSLHDALPISRKRKADENLGQRWTQRFLPRRSKEGQQVHENLFTLIKSEAKANPNRNDIAADRKSTRLNSSHANISYAVFCLKKKKNNYTMSY